MNFSVFPTNRFLGHFGIVMKAVHRDPAGTTTDVAVKALRRNNCYKFLICNPSTTSVHYLAGVHGVYEFLQEGIRMADFDNERVMSLIGISFTVDNRPLIVTPFMPRGDLLSYLKDPDNVCKCSAYIQSIVA